MSRADEASVAALSRGLTQPPRRRARDRWFLVGATEERIAIPETVLHLLTRAVELLARGDAVAVVPVEQYVTTQEAADLLNVSRQYLVRLLDAGTLPFTKTGKHRRVRVEDILRFRTMRDAERAATLDELTRMTEDIGGYKEPKWVGLVHAPEVTHPAPRRAGDARIERRFWREPFARPHELGPGSGEDGSVRATVMEVVVISGPG